jgi:hypothetical protein
MCRLKQRQWELGVAGWVKSNVSPNVWQSLGGGMCAVCGFQGSCATGSKETHRMASLRDGLLAEVRDGGDLRKQPVGKALFGQLPKPRKT